MKFNQKITADLSISCISIDKAKKQQENFSFYNSNQDLYFVYDPKIEFDSKDFSRSIGVLLLKNNDKNLNFYLDSFIKISSEMAQQIIDIIIMRTQTIYEHSFSLKTKQKIYEINFIYNAKIKSMLDISLNLAKAAKEAKYLQLLPNNLLDSAIYIKHINTLFADLTSKVKIKIIKQEELKKLKMNLFVATNKGSDNEAALVILEYKANKTDKKSVGLIGKGILFDSGGYNLKPSSSLLTMNQDMTGSAVVMATIYALAKNNIKTNVIGFLPLAKNMISAKSFVPNDIYSTYDKQTVEIMDTDAEGRLILVDTLAYATKNYDFSCVLTIATLTGITALAFGDIYTAYWATSEKAKSAIETAAKISGDYVWNMPLHKEYFESMKSSKVADYVNWNPTVRKASNSTAAAFLSMFCHNDNYIHMDIAGTNEFKSAYIPPMILTLYNLVKGNN